MLAAPSGRTHSEGHLTVRTVKDHLVTSVSVDSSHQSFNNTEVILKSFLAIGAKQFVVHEAPEITVSVPSRISWLVLNTTVLTSDPGAVINNFLAPPACKCSFSAAALK